MTKNTNTTKNMSKKSATLCLVMIVKNEVKVLPRCFDSIKDYIDTYCICDTGSDDGTPEFITKYWSEKGVKGTVHHVPWTDFGYNRTKAVQKAQGTADYLVLMDADFVFVPKDTDFKQKIPTNKDGFLIKYEGGLDYRQMLFVSGAKKWKYVGRTHESIQLANKNQCTSDVFDGFTFLHHADGGNRSDKFQRDKKLLLLDMKEDPKNSRSCFYLAQTCKDLKEYEEACEWYTKRLTLAGWPEEDYYARYQLGICTLSADPNKNFFRALGYLLEAWDSRPGRLESLYHLVKSCRMRGKYLYGFQIGMMAINTPYPRADKLFIEKAVHQWQFKHEVAQCGLFLGKFKTASNIWKQILKERHFPPQALASIKKYYEMSLKQVQFSVKNPDAATLTARNSKNGQCTIIIHLRSEINNLMELVGSAMMQNNVDAIYVHLNANSDSWNDCFVQEVRTICKRVGGKMLMERGSRLALLNKIKITSEFLLIHDQDRLLGSRAVDQFINERTKIRGASDDKLDPLLGYWGWRLDGEDNSKDQFVAATDSSVDYLCGLWFGPTKKFYQSISAAVNQGQGVKKGKGKDKGKGKNAKPVNIMDDSIIAADDVDFCLNIGQCRVIKGNEYDVIAIYNGDNSFNNRLSNEDQLRQNMVDKYCKKGYITTLSPNYKDLLAQREIIAPDPVSGSRPSPSPKTGQKVCIYVHDWTSIGGSEKTINDLYHRMMCDLGDKIVIKITNQPADVLQMQPDLLITQQRAVQTCAKLAERLDIPFWTLLHGPNQGMRHPKAELYIYNSKQLLESDGHRFPGSQTCYLQPSIDIDGMSAVKGGKSGGTITFIGSTSYNYLKGCDVVVELARCMPKHQFVYVGPVEELTYGKEYFLVGKLQALEPESIIYRPQQLPENLKVVQNTPDLKPILEQTAAIIVPSLVESFGRVTVEAAACGIPVVCSALPGLIESTANLATYVKNHRNIDDWRTAVEGVLSNYADHQQKCSLSVEQYQKLQESSLKTLYNYLSPQTQIHTQPQQPQTFYYINLDRREDRSENFIKESKKVESTAYEFERVSAVDALKLDMTPENCRLLQKNSFDSRRGPLACALSHIKIWKRMLESEKKYVVIFEDDVKLCPNFANKWRLIQKQSGPLEHMDMLFLAYRVTPRLEETIQYTSSATDNMKILPMMMCNYWAGTEGYLITRKGAEFLLNIIENEGLCQPLDTLMMYAFQGRFNTLSNRPFKACGVAPRLGKAPDPNIDKADTDIHNDGETVPFTYKIVIDDRIDNDALIKIVEHRNQFYSEKSPPMFIRLDNTAGESNAPTVHYNDKSNLLKNGDGDTLDLSSCAEISHTVTWLNTCYHKYWSRNNQL